MGNEWATKEIERLRDETIVLRHKIDWREPPRSPGKIQRFHDIPNCEFCTILDGFQAAIHVHQ